MAIELADEMTPGEAPPQRLPGSRPGWGYGNVPPELN